MKFAAAGSLVQRGTDAWTPPPARGSIFPMTDKRTSETAFESAIEAVLLHDGYRRIDGKGFDRERALFPEEALAFIRGTQAKLWDKLEALHGEHTGARVLESLCKWLDPSTFLGEYKTQLVLILPRSPEQPRPGCTPPKRSTTTVRTGPRPGSMEARWVIRPSRFTSNGWPALTGGKARR